MNMSAPVSSSVAQRNEPWLAIKSNTEENPAELSSYLIIRNHTVLVFHTRLPALSTWNLTISHMKLQYISATFYVFSSLPLCFQ